MNHLWETLYSFIVAWRGVMREPITLKTQFFFSSVVDNNYNFKPDFRINWQDSYYTGKFYTKKVFN